MPVHLYLGTLSMEEALRPRPGLQPLTPDVDEPSLANGVSNLGIVGRGRCPSWRDAEGGGMQAVRPHCWAPVVTAT